MPKKSPTTLPKTLSKSPPKSPPKSPSDESQAPASLSISGVSREATPGRRSVGAPAELEALETKTRVILGPESPTRLALDRLRGADASNRRQLLGNTLYATIGVDPRQFLGDLETLDLVLLETLDRTEADDLSCANFDKLIETINCQEVGSMACILINILAPSIIAQLIEDRP